MAYKGRLEDRDQSAMTVQVFIPESVAHSSEDQGNITVRVSIPRSLNSRPATKIPVNLEIHKVPAGTSDSSTH